MEKQVGINDTLSAQGAPAASIGFGQYPVNWYKQFPSVVGPLPEPSGRRRPSNPITIPKSEYTRRSSGITPISPTSRVICLRCGLHSRPSTVDIVEFGGCSPKDVRVPSYFPNPSAVRVGQDIQRSQHWPTDRCEGWCRDAVMPPSRLSSVDSGFSIGSSDGQKRRHHHRRRSSLCIGQYLADGEEDIKWSGNRDVSVSDKMEADRIAQKVMAKGRKGSKMSYGSISTDSAISEV